MDAFQVEELRLYFGDDIKIADGVVLRNPKVQNIVEYGESKYFSLAQTIATTPSAFKVQLDAMGLDWEKVSDFQLFMMLCKQLKQEDTEILLGDLDLSQLNPYQMGDSDKIVLSNEDHTINIDEIVYEMLASYVRKMHNFHKQVDKAGNRAAHRALLMAAKQDAKIAASKPHKSFLKPIISAVKCRMGYTMDYIKGMNIYEVLDDLSRLNVITQADAALSGCYSGMVDSSKMDRTILDWTRDTTEEANLEKQNRSNKKLTQGAN